MKVMFFLVTFFMLQMQPLFPQDLLLTGKGVKTFEIGQILHDNSFDYVVDIDTSTLEGIMEFQLVSAGFETRTGYTFGKVDLSKFNQKNHQIKKVLLGVSADKVVRKIWIEIGLHDPAKTVKFFDSLYQREVTLETTIQDILQSVSYSWAAEDFDIYFSSGTRDIFFTSRIK